MADMGKVALDWTDRDQRAHYVYLQCGCSYTKYSARNYDLSDAAGRSDPCAKPPSGMGVSVPGLPSSARCGAVTHAGTWRTGHGSSARRSGGGEVEGGSIRNQSPVSAINWVFFPCPLPVFFRGVNSHWESCAQRVTFWQVGRLYYASTSSDGIWYTDLHRGYRRGSIPRQGYRWQGVLETVRQLKGAERNQRFDFCPPQIQKFQATLTSDLAAQ